MTTVVNRLRAGRFARAGSGVATRLPAFRDCRNDAFIPTPQQTIARRRRSHLPVGCGRCALDNAAAHAIAVPERKMNETPN